MAGAASRRDVLSLAGSGLLLCLGASPAIDGSAAGRRVRDRQQIS
jgi:hypothetical protein